ncbi:SIMPL domain-containing protein [Maribellus maritimus]|uniref:SIMPL domain-containing protein n=1 Tax=Maribellus maritimus TaxID=2870838 RepID=UPI001EEC2AAD|nr:SIMPL domain-containing protein [Maribellus maritimus]MCG6187178.1 SIMPL domain-containing protein [Maribellus maritimus]
MKKIILIAFVVFSISSFAQPGEKNFIDQNYIEVTGNAEMEIVPDEIYLKIVVNEKDFKGKEDLQKLEKSMIQALSKIGIDVSEQLTIRDMASNFQKYWLKGTEINSVKEYQLKVESANTAGQVIRDLETLGLSNISVEKIDHSKIQEFKTEVKVMAIKAAKEKAVSLTGAIDQKIGKAIYIQEQNNHIYNALQGKVAGISNIAVRGYGYSDEMELKQPDIEFEKIKLEYSILVRFEIE